jgi:hypothetical protein
MDHRLIEIVACPVCKGKLQFKAITNELICRFDRLAYPIEDGIPVLLENQARTMTLEELEA